MRIGDTPLGSAADANETDGGEVGRSVHDGLRCDLPSSKKVDSREDPCYFLVRSCDDYEFIVDVFAIGHYCAAFEPLVRNALKREEEMSELQPGAQWEEAKMRRIRLKEKCFTKQVVETLLRFVLHTRENTEAYPLHFEVESMLDPDFALRCVAAADFLQCAIFLEASIHCLLNPWLMQIEATFGSKGVCRSVKKQIPPHLYVQVLSGIVSDLCFSLFREDLLIFEGANESKRLRKKTLNKKTKHEPKGMSKKGRVASTPAVKRRKTLLTQAEWKTVWLAHYTNCAKSLAGSIEYGPPQTSIMSMLPRKLARLYEDADIIDKQASTTHAKEKDEGLSLDLKQQSKGEMLPGFKTCYHELKLLVRYSACPQRFQLDCALDDAKALDLGAAKTFQENAQHPVKIATKIKYSPPRAPTPLSNRPLPDVSSHTTLTSSQSDSKTSLNIHIPGTRGRRRVHLNRCGGGFSLPPAPQGWLDAKRRLRRAAAEAKAKTSTSERSCNNRRNRDVNRAVKKRPQGQCMGKEESDTLPSIPFESVHMQAMEVFAPRPRWTEVTILQDVVLKSPPVNGGTHLLKLCLRGIASLGDDTVSHIVSSFPNITDLDLSVGGVGRVGDEDGVRLRGYKREADKYGCSEDDSIGGTDKSLRVLAKLKALKSLQLCNWSRITESGLISFFNSLPRSRLLPPRRLSNDMPGGLKNRYAMLLPSLSPMRDMRADVKIMTAELQELNLSSCRGAVTDAAIEAFSKKMQGVVTLQLYSCYHLTDNAVFSLADPDLRIKRLNVSGCYRIHDQTVHQCLLTTHHDLLLYQNPNDFRKLPESRGMGSSP